MKKEKTAKTGAKKKSILSFVLVLVMILSFSLTAYAADDELYVYESGYTSGSLSWKMFNRLQGYDQLGTYITDVGTFKATYEYRVGGTAGGELIYKWVWDGTKFSSPILNAAKGPTNLTVTTSYTASTGLQITVPLRNVENTTVDANGYYIYPAVFDGYADLTLKVSDYYADGTILIITGEYNENAKTAGDIPYNKEVEVKDGYIHLQLDRGGVYTAIKKVNTTVYDATSTTASLSWKAFNALLGYNDVGTTLTGIPTTGAYEFRVGGTSNGALKYAWTFDGSKFSSPITDAIKGPINLAVTTSYEASTGLGMHFDLYTPHTGTDNTLSGNAKLKINVSNNFTNGTKVTISGPDGKNSEVSVIDGYISFDVNKGGNYVAKANVVSDGQKPYPAVNLETQADNTMIKISANEGVIPEGSSFEIKSVTSGENYQKALTSIGNNGLNLMLFDISLLDDSGNKIQPNGNVTFKIPVPNGYDNPIVYYVANDGTLTKLESVIEDGYIIFTTNHFSLYAIGNASTPVTGDDTQTGILLCFVAISGGAIVFLRKKGRLEN